LLVFEKDGRLRVKWIALESKMRTNHGG
jgi:hypothetical protein